MEWVNATFTAYHTSVVQITCLLLAIIDSFLDSQAHNARTYFVRSWLLGKILSLYSELMIAVLLSLYLNQQLAYRNALAPVLISSYAQFPDSWAWHHSTKHTLTCPKFQAHPELFPGRTFFPVPCKYSVFTVHVQMSGQDNLRHQNTGCIWVQVIYCWKRTFCSSTHSSAPRTGTTNPRCAQKSQNRHDLGSLRPPPTIYSMISQLFCWTLPSDLNSARCK